jgi:hypothetical protein
LFYTERAFALLTLLLISAYVYFGVQRGRRGTLPPVRPIAGLLAIEEAIGRATEMGKPVHYATGSGDLVSDVAPQTLAAIDILGYVAKTCAKYNCALIVTNRSPVVHPITQGIVTQAFREEGAIERLRPDTVQFLSDQQWAYAAAAQGIIKRERVAANIMIGPFYAESLTLAEAGAQVGAIQIGATTRMYQLPFFVAACDYTLLGDEMYAGGAYVSKDPVRLGNVLGQDWAKITCIALLLLGAVSKTFGWGFFTTLFTKYGK